LARNGDGSRAKESLDFTETRGGPMIARAGDAGGEACSGVPSPSSFQRYGTSFELPRSRFSSVTRDV